MAAQVKAELNAEASGNIAEWERLMSRHLEEIDRSDPDLCFSYAIFLYRTTIDNQEESIKWSGYALENKHKWEGDEFVKKVSSLYKLRAESAAKLWRHAEELYGKEPTAEHDEMTVVHLPQQGVGLAGVADPLGDGLSLGRPAGVRDEAVHAMPEVPELGGHEPRA